MPIRLVNMEIVSVSLCLICNKPETVSHFLIECPNNVVCSAVHAACSKFDLIPTLDVVLSDSRLHNVIISSLDKKFALAV